MTGGQDTPFACKRALSAADIKEGKKKPRVLVEIYKGDDKSWHIMLSRRDKWFAHFNLFRKPKVVVRK